MSPSSQSEVRVGLACSRCKGELLPITSGEAITFFCDNAHETPIEQLIGEHPEKADRPLQALISAWHKNAMALELIAKDARSKGHFSAMDILQRHIKTLESRIDLLRRAIDKQLPPKA